MELSWWTRTRAAVAFTGVLVAARGISYFPPLVNPERSPAHWLESLGPTWFFGVLWLAVAAVCFAVLACEKLLPIAVGLAIGIHAAWAASFIFETLFGDAPRAWVTAIGYLHIAGLLALVFAPAHVVVKIQKE